MGSINGLKINHLASSSEDRSKRLGLLPGAHLLWLLLAGRLLLLDLVFFSIRTYFNHGLGLRLYGDFPLSGLWGCSNGSIWDRFLQLLVFALCIGKYLGTETPARIREKTPLCKYFCTTSSYKSLNSIQNTLF